MATENENLSYALKNCRTTGTRIKIAILITHSCRPLAVRCAFPHLGNQSLKLREKEVLYECPQARLKLTTVQINRQVELNRELKRQRVELEETVYAEGVTKGI